VNTRIAVLLGAGASRPAGIPLAREMVQQLLTGSDLVLPELQDGFRRVLAYVGDRLASDDARRGRSTVVDVERLFDAVVELSRKDEYEAAAFIDAWDPGLDALADDRDFRQPFGLVAGLAPSAVAKIVEVDPGTDLAYLDPLFDLFRRQGSLTIATLNYDRTVEMGAEKAGVLLSTGLPAWLKDGALGFTDNALRLLKLHGTAEIYSIQGHSDSPPAWRVRDQTRIGDAYYEVGQPMISFGGRSKLRADGPFVDLFHEFRQELKQAEAVVVAGYSFRDTHINQLLQEAQNRAAKLVWLDPEWPRSNPPVNHTYNPTDLIKGGMENLAEAIECAEVPINDCLRTKEGRCFRRRPDGSAYPDWCRPGISPTGPPAIVRGL
jgi:NAD-dependent SIR2 family protein deacetylase